jgi:hypothetical protein
MRLSSLGEEVFQRGLSAPFFILIAKQGANPFVLNESINDSQHRRVFTDLRGVRAVMHYRNRAHVHE